MYTCVLTLMYMTVIKRERLHSVFVFCWFLYILLVKLLIHYNAGHVFGLEYLHIQKKRRKKKKKKKENIDEQKKKKNATLNLKRNTSIESGMRLKLPLQQWWQIWTDDVLTLTRHITPSLYWTALSHFQFFILADCSASSFVLHTAGLCPNGRGAQQDWGADGGWCRPVPHPAFLTGDGPGWPGHRRTSTPSAG